MHISKHSCYRTMFDYISVATQKKPAGELDNNAWTSPNHPALNQLPAPPANLQTMWQARGNKARRQAAGESVESMKVLEFYDFCRQRKQSQKFHFPWRAQNCFHRRALYIINRRSNRKDRLNTKLSMSYVKGSCLFNETEHVVFNRLTSVRMFLIHTLTRKPAPPSEMELPLFHPP